MFFCAYTENGVIFQTGASSEPSTFDHMPFDVLVTESEIDARSHYVDLSGEKPTVVKMPDSPGPYHDFDYTTRAWMPRLADAMTARKAEVDAERARRSLLPITVNSVTLDADSVAQQNLSDKKTEAEECIRLGIEMPSDLLIWKDYGNAVHTFDTPKAYLDFISGFLVALAERSTRLYMAAWAHKDAISALDSVEVVLTYSIEDGWP